MANQRLILKMSVNIFIYVHNQIRNEGNKNRFRVN